MCRVMFLLFMFVVVGTALKCGYQKKLYNIGGYDHPVICPNTGVVGHEELMCAQCVLCGEKFLSNGWYGPDGNCHAAEGYYQDFGHWYDLTIPVERALVPYTEAAQWNFEWVLGAGLNPDIATDFDQGSETCKSYCKSQTYYTAPCNGIKMHLQSSGSWSCSFFRANAIGPALEGARKHFLYDFDKVFLACPVGTSTVDPGATSVSECVCSPGYTQSDSVCVECASNTYKNIHGSDECTPCVPGTFSGVGAIKCNTCDAGKYLDSQNVCQPCGVGEFSLEGVGICSDCVAGKYSVVTGASACVNCAAGKYSTVTGAATAETCVACNTGMFLAVVGGSVCQSCVEGKYSAVAGASVCTHCAAGKFSTKYAASTDAWCSNCGVGKYSAVTGASVCVECVAGKFSSLTAATSADTCTSCGPGKYSAVTGASVCAECAAGKFSTALNAMSVETCVNCAAGKYSTAGKNFCITCGAGTYSVGAVSACTVCATGTYAGTGASVCVACVVGKFYASDGAVDASMCQDCGAGAYAAAGASVCGQCVAGKFSAAKYAADASTCQDCGAGAYAAAGASVCGQCVAGKFSAVMYAGDEGTCVACGLNTFSASSGASACIQCPMNSYTLAVGASECGCDAGYVSAEATGACEPCDAGTFRDMDLTICNMCAPDTDSDRGAATCEPCANGTFSTTGVCEPCAAGTYRELQEKLWTGLERWEQAAAGETCAEACARKGLVCTESELGLEDFELMRSCAVVIGCNAGEECAWFYPLSEVHGVCAPGLAVCDRRRPDELVDYNGHLLCPCERRADLSRCVPCPDGEYAAAGASECVECGDGEQPSVDRSECVVCGAGFGWKPRPARCELCDAGKYGDGMACVACESGETSGAGVAVCSSCQTGSYSVDGTACVLCEAGKYSEGGASACTLCAPGSFQPQSGEGWCEACAAGKFSAAAGTATEAGCVLCGAGTYSESQASACTACVVGTYSVAAGATACAPCPPGTTTAVAGATDLASCLPCVDGMFAAEIGSAACTACNGTVVTTSGVESWKDGVEGYAVDLPYGCKHTCPAGYFAENNFVSRVFGCAPCAVGTYKHAQSTASACLVCPVQMTTAAPGAHSCVCEKGFALGADGVCAACADGVFKPVVGNMSCWECGGGAQWIDRQTCECDAGAYFDATHLLGAGLPCKTCPRYRTTKMSGAIAVADCVCNDELNIEACAECASGCQCSAGYTLDEASGACVVCGPDVECVVTLDSAGARLGATAAMLAFAWLLPFMFQYEYAHEFLF